MPRNHARVLILDDEYYLGQMLAQALTAEKIQTIAVTEVDSAIDWLSKTSFDLVVSDIYLPGKTGIDLFNFVKNSKIEVPFIFMTGNPDLEVAVNFFTRGGYDYIIKPFMIPDFLKKVNVVIRNHKLERQEKNLVKDLRSLLATRLSELNIYQDVFESTDDGIVIADLDGNIVKVNQGFENITGMTNIQLLHQHLDILGHSLLPGLKFGTIVETLKTESSWHADLEGKRNLDETWYNSITFSPIKNEESSVFAYAGIFKDVTAQRRVEQALIGSLKQMNLAQEAIIFGMARLAEHRDQTTGYHLERIRDYCRTLAEALIERKKYRSVINNEFVQMLCRTATLHDIGKVGIPDYILLKEDKLSQPEFEIMKSHTSIGYHTLNSIREQYGDMEFLKMGIEISYCHHERWNGSGYPQGLKGEKIPLSAQILAVADVYDALTTRRSYKEAFSHEHAIEIMQQEKGKHFSPHIFDVFMEIVDQFDEIRKKFQMENTDPDFPENQPVDANTI